MWICFIIIFIISALLVIQSIRFNKQTKRINQLTSEAYEEINEDLLSKSVELKCIKNQLEDYKISLNKAQQDYNEHIAKINADQLSQEKELQDKAKKVITFYNDETQKAIKYFEKAKNEVINIQASLNAIKEAEIRSNDIKDNKEKYSLNIPVDEQNDIQVLEKIKSQLNKPRILSMLIWSTYFQKRMTALCNNIIGLKQVSGIYKITNTITNECYIGQSVNISDRWKTHAKCGLGIDTPTGNKLYEAMRNYGIQNFTWEVLEECDKTVMNEKERFYIELFQSKEYGYNSNSGVSK